MEIFKGKVTYHPSGNMTSKEFNELKSLILDIKEKVSRIAGDELLTPNEVCEMRKFSKSTYKRLVKTGVINQIRIAPGSNTKVYAHRSEIEKLIDEGKI